MRLNLKVRYQGKTYAEDVTSPLDGVTRPVDPPVSDTEKDTISGTWDNDAVVFIVNRYVTQSDGTVKHTAHQVRATLTDPDTLDGKLFDLDDNGNASNQKEMTFNRESPALR
jgi:hypothetical protein